MKLELSEAVEIKLAEESSKNLKFEQFDLQSVFKSKSIKPHPGS